MNVAIELLISGSRLKFLQHNPVASVAAIAFVILAIFAQPARAQDQAQKKSGNDGIRSAGEIVVTARRREEPVLTTPVSVTAFSGSQIQARQADSLEPLARSAPNVTYESGANIAGGGHVYTAFIRGIGQNDFLLTIDPGVGLYVDGVYVSRTVGGLLDTFDVASVQILRGPQGTLFGKNTIGGAILVDSVAPSPEFDARVEATLGSRARTGLRGMVNLPLSPTAALRIEGAGEKQRGYVRRLFDGASMGNRNSASGRISLAVDATPDIRLLLKLDGTRAREQGAPATLLAATNQIVVPDPQAPPNFGFFYNLTQAGGQCGIPPFPPVPASQQCFGPHFITGNPFTTWAGGGNQSDLDQWGASLHVDAVAGPIKLKSITAYRDVRSAFYLDIDSSPLRVSETENDYRYSQFSQELTASTTAVDALDLLTGLFYLRERGTDDNRLRFSIADFVSGGTVLNESLGVYGHAVATLSPKLRVSAGARYSHENKKFTPDQFIQTDRTGGALLGLSRLLIPPQLNPNGNRILPNVTSSYVIDKVTPSASVTYLVSDNATIYASYAEGFKAGGFTQRVFPPEAVTPDFAPERVRSFEIGAKLALPRQLGSIISSVFRADYDDLQLIINAGLAPKVENAGKARIWGGELEITLRPAAAIRLDVSAGYSDARYLDVSPNAFPVVVSSRLPNAPRWTLAGSATAELWRRGRTRLSGHAEFSYKSSHFKDANNSAVLFQPGYGLINANLTLSLPQLGVDVILGAANLADEKYLVSGYSELAIQAAAYGVYGRPREFYLRLRKDL